MKKHELIKYAYDNYKAGQKYKHKINSDDHIIESQDFDITDDGNVRGERNKGMLYYNGEWAEIIPESILSGKCAIQVNNEREFKLLMKHYESKGWKSAMGYISNNQQQWFFVKQPSEYENIISYHDRFIRLSHSFSEFNPDELGYKVIPFTDFAAEVGIKVPVFVMKSEDGVDLYEGDECYIPQYGDNSKLSGNISLTTVRPIHKLTKGVGKFFSSKEVAEKWIKEQNKPKGIEVTLSPAHSVFITKDNMRFKMNGVLILSILSDELEAIYKDFKSLQP